MADVDWDDANINEAHEADLPPLSDDEAAEEIFLQNDSVAHFDQHRDSIFAIAQHPTRPTVIATGGSEGDGDDAPGMAYVFDSGLAPERPVLPASFSSSGVAGQRGDERPQPETLPALFKVEGHSDSVTALAWGNPNGEVLFSGGMDGRLRAYKVNLDASPPTLDFLADAQEVKEVNWLSACPAAAYGNTVALGAEDGSVWVYTADPAGTGADALTNLQSYFLHGDSCTAGAWTPDGRLLVTISQDGTLYAWDVWGEARAGGAVGAGEQAVIKLTGDDQRFAIEGGLYSLAVEPRGAYVAVGGAEGAIRIVSLPQLGGVAGAAGKQQQGKGKGGKGGKTSAGGQILAALQKQKDSVESLSISTISTGGAAGATTTLLAAGSVDGSIVVYDATRQFAIRRAIPAAHGGLSVVKVEFVPGTWLLTSCGIDGVVRRWDLRGTAATTAAAGKAAANAPPATAAEAGMVGEWRGHRGGEVDDDDDDEDGEASGGVLGFVQGQTGARIITAGDDGLALVFDV